MPETAAERISKMKSDLQFGAAPLLGEYAHDAFRIDFDRNEDVWRVTLGIRHVAEVRIDDVDLLLDRVEEVGRRLALMLADSLAGTVEMINERRDRM